MSLVLTEAPAQEPLSLEDAKRHLVVEHSEDDALIQRLIVSARQWTEEVLWRQLITATYVLRLHVPPCGALFVPRPKLREVTSIQYVDWNGTTQTWDDAEYQVDIYSEPGIILPAYGASWPASKHQLNSFIVTFEAGYGDEPSDVPEPIRSAMLDLVTHWYENREPVITGTIATDLNLMVKQKLAPYTFRDERILKFV